MRTSIPFLAGFLAGLLVPSSWADVLVVPDDHARLEDAVAAADGGDVILVRTTAEQGAFGVRVTKPLTIVGDPICNVDLRFGGIELDGPGGGVVTLVNVAVDYLSADENGYPSLWGGGFDELHLVGSRIVHQNLAPSGLITSSHPALDLDGPMLVTVVDSELVGGNAGSDVCAPPTLYQNGREAILAPEATVILLDSTATGGNGGRDGFGGVTLDMCCASCECPSDLASWGGAGGDGVVAAELHALRSTVRGGEGIAWYAFPSGTDANPAGTPTYCGERPDGARYVVSGSLVVSAASPLFADTTRPPLSGEWGLGWDVQALPTCRPGESGCYLGATGLLLASVTPLRRPFAFGAYWGYLDVGTIGLVATFPATRPSELQLAVPSDLRLVGTTVTAQVALSTGYLSPPVVGTIVP